VNDESVTPTQPRKSVTRDQLYVHRAMVLWLFAVTLVVTATLSVVLYITDPTLHDPSGKNAPGPSSVLLIVCLAGALGGFVSRLRRLYAFEDIFPRQEYAVLFRRLDLYLIAYSSIPPLVGAIAAAVVYGVFAAKLVEGPMFPVFNCTASDGSCSSIQAVYGYWRPAEATDYAKSAVWGFVSGFSERFFVDILNRLGSKGAQDEPAT
jgi:hypothetical protein